MSGLKKNCFVDLDMNDSDILNALTGIVFQNATVLQTDSIRTAIAKLAGSNAVGLANSVVQSSINFITTSASDVTITSMSATPPSGTYVILYSGNNLHSANNSIATTSIYKNAVQTLDSVRTIQASGGGWTGTASSQTTLSLNGTDVVTIKTSISNGQLTVSGRSIILLRVGAA